MGESIAFPLPPLEICAFSAQPVHAMTVSRAVAWSGEVTANLRVAVRASVEQQKVCHYDERTEYVGIPMSPTMFVQTCAFADVPPCIER